MQKVVGGRVPQHVAVLCGAVVKAHMRRRDMEELAVSLLHRGVSPDITQVNFSEHAFDLVLDHVKYLVQVAMGSPSMFVLKVNSDVVEAEAVMRSGAPQEHGCETGSQEHSKIARRFASACTYFCGCDVNPRCLELTSWYPLASEVKP